MNFAGLRWTTLDYDGLRWTPMDYDGIREDRNAEDRRHDEQREKTSSEEDRRTDSDRSQVQAADSIEGSTLEANTQLVTGAEERSAELTANEAANDWPSNKMRTHSKGVTCICMKSRGLFEQKTSFVKKSGSTYGE